MDYIQAIKNFEPMNEQEQNDKKLILKFIKKSYGKVAPQRATFFGFGGVYRETF